jgi:transglycosylase-like protein
MNGGGSSVSQRWRYPAALVVAAGIGFPAFAMAASEQTGGLSSPQQKKTPQGYKAKQAHKGAKPRRHEQRFAHLPGGVSLSTLNSIADCESGGDPNAVSSDGTYRGKYQFDFGTWASVGGHGDPVRASEREQDYRAALLYVRSGSSSWPVCA